MVSYELEGKCSGCSRFNKCPILQLTQAILSIKPDAFLSSPYKRLKDLHTKLDAVALIGFDDSNQLVRFRVNYNGCLGVVESWVK